MVKILFTYVVVEWTLVQKFKLFEVKKRERNFRTFELCYNMNRNFPLKLRQDCFQPNYVLIFKYLFAKA